MCHALHCDGVRFPASLQIYGAKGKAAGMRPNYCYDHAFSAISEYFSYNGFFKFQKWEVRFLPAPQSPGEGLSCQSKSNLVFVPSGPPEGFLKLLSHEKFCPLCHCARMRSRYISFCCTHSYRFFCLHRFCHNRSGAYVMAYQERQGGRTGCRNGADPYS